MYKAFLLVFVTIGCGSSDSVRVHGQVVSEAGDTLAGAKIAAEAYWLGECDGGNCDVSTTKCTQTDSNGRFSVELTGSTDWGDLDRGGAGFGAVAPGYGVNYCENSDVCVLTPCAAEDARCEGAFDNFACVDEMTEGS